MMEDEKSDVDMEDLTDRLLKTGHRVRAIEVSGDPDKYREICVRMGEDILEICGRDLPLDEINRLIDERTAEGLKEIKDAGIEYAIRPLFGEWPPAPTSEN